MTTLSSGQSRFHTFTGWVQPALGSSSQEHRSWQQGTLFTNKLPGYPCPALQPRLLICGTEKEEAGHQQSSAQPMEGALSTAVSICWHQAQESLGWGGLA